MDIQDIDAIRINFNKDALMLLNICIGFIMFGVSLHLKRSDFSALYERPQSIIIGLISQVILLPLITLALIWAFQLPWSISLGMILVACCPGGNISNFAAAWSRSNVTLSICLTSIITILASIVTPLSFYIWTHCLPSKVFAQQSISVDFSELLQIIGLILLIPLVLGILFKRWQPRLTEKIKMPVSVISVVLIIGFIVVALMNNLEYIWGTLGAIFWIVFLHNGLGYLGGYYFSRSLGESAYNGRAIALETGVQNSALALVVIFNFYQDVGGMLIIAAWWGVWNIASALLLATIWRLYAKKNSE